MPSRYSWKGHLRLSLVTIQVAAYNTASSEGGKVHFRQLHEACHTPIKYQKVCPVHGEVSQDEIVLGYEFEKDRYALVSPAERQALQGGRERAITIEAFTDLDAIDPTYFEGGSYFLLPDGKVAERPYDVLRQALAARNVCGVGRFSVGEKNQLMLVRAQDGVIVADTLRFSSQLKSADDFQKDLPVVSATKDEVRLAEALIDATSPKVFDLATFEDNYGSRVQELIASKIAGDEVAGAAPDSAVQGAISAPNLMDALKQSIADKKNAKSLKSPIAKVQVLPAKPSAVRAAARRTRPRKSG